MKNFKIIKFEANFDFTEMSFELINPILISDYDKWKVKFDASLKYVDDINNIAGCVIITFDFDQCINEDDAREIVENLAKRFNINFNALKKIEKALAIKNIFSEYKNTH